MEDIWKNFDQIFILTDDYAKLPKIKKNFKKFGIKNANVVKYENVTEIEDEIEDEIKTINLRDRINMINEVNNQICNKRCQHQKSKMIDIIKMSHQEKYNNILILKDDCKFRDSFNYINLLKAINWMSLHDWDIFYLGYGQWPMMMSFFVGSSIVKLLKPSGTFAYSISKNGLYKLNMMLKHGDIQFNNNINLDKLYGNSKIKKFGIFPTICYGNESDSLEKLNRQFNMHIELKKINEISEYVSLGVPFLIGIIICLCYYMFYKKYIA